MIRSVEQYLESLRDGRVIYCLGERVKDVTAHPLLGNVIRSSAMDYFFPKDPRYRDLFVAKNEEGEDVNALFISPKSAEDLLKRREIFVTTWRTGGGTQLHCMGIDALEASSVVADRMDKRLGTGYVERVKAYRKYLQKGDLGITGAMTDVKGDRSLRPSKQEKHQDYYVRVVDRQKEGIVVRGAKMHISSTPGANEAIVMPSRAHSEEDKDYAVVFATPLNAKGITMIASEPPMRESGDPGLWDYPVSTAYGHGASECMIVFDDVFVPWERVFLCGEWKFSRDVTYAFATFHRLFGVSRMTTELELLAGVSALVAEYNGVENVSHIRDKLAWLAMYAEAVSVIGKSSCLYCEKGSDSDIASPNTVYTNTAKFLFADNYHQAVKTAQDICGGIADTIPSYWDWKNPETRPLMEKYLGGKAGTSTEHRLRAVRLLKDLTNPHFQVGSIHGEGSLAAQRMFVYAGAEWDRYKAAAKRAAGIPGWEKDPTFGSLPNYPSCIAPKLPKLDESYRL
ncbi:MAG: 4-hydroxybutyryl-CoA dehydratase [Desulfobacteraceae bacterium]|nr:MAG: 4-hydroxybutyryl-CoA dehydratase [Desulfobacteraceae bacterium]